MEKRFLHFVLLSIIVLIVWARFFAPPPVPKPTATDETGSAAPFDPTDPTDPFHSAGPADRAVETSPELVLAPIIGELVQEAEERDTGDLIFGRLGDVGTYQARFSNRGARLVELRIADFVNREGLEGYERDEPEAWVRLLTPIMQTDGRETGSMLLRTSASSKDLERGVPLEEALWAMEVLNDSGGAPRGVEFQLAPGSGVRFVKRFLFEPGSRRFLVELELHNEGQASATTCEFIFTPASCMPPELDDRFYIEPQAVAVGPLGAPVEDMSLALERKLDTARDHGGALTVSPPLAIAGVHNKYFAILMRELRSDPTAKATMIGANYARVWDADWAALNPEERNGAWRFIDTDVFLELRLPEPGKSQTYSYEIFAGPKERESFLAADSAHSLVLDKDLGWMSGVGKFLVGVLGLLHTLTNNWGASIIILTVCIRVILFPLNRRFQTSMARYQKKMKRVQPKIQELKERYKNDQQKQRQEQAKLMQEEGAFPPLGGCLPMFLQIPIFIGLFSALRTNFNLRHAPFAGWITDLSQPDRLLTLDFDIPLLVTSIHVEYLNILPILMVVLWVLQQRGMPAPADEQAARMQKMMTFMPVVMGFFLYNYAAGLSLYMITQSGLGIFEQKFIKKHWPIDDTEVETKPKGCGPFAGFMENVAKKQKEHMKRMEGMQKNSGKNQKGKKGKRK